MEYSVAELKEILKARKQKVGGKKIDLIDRLFLALKKPTTNKNLLRRAVWTDFYETISLIKKISKITAGSQWKQLQSTTPVKNTAGIHLTCSKNIWKSYEHNTTKKCNKLLKLTIWLYWWNGG